MLLANLRTGILQLIVVSFIAALLGYYVGVNKVTVDWKNYKPQVSVINKEPPSRVSSNLDLFLFWSVFDRIQSDYYDKTIIDPQKMLTGAIMGMVSSLEDPYTVYLPPLQNNNFKQGMAGQFEGIGAELGIKENRVIVISPLDGMPAEKAGIRAGDFILSVDEKPTDGWTLAQTVDKIRGSKGTSVKLSILHKDETKPMDISITRGTITVKSVVGSVKNVSDIENISVASTSAQSTKDSVQSNKKDKSAIPLLGEKNKVAYIRLSQFGDNTNTEWINMVNDVVLQIKASNGTVKGVVLDVRNNPGGYLTDATFIASEFLKEGKLVVVQEKSPTERLEFKVTRKGLLLDIPVIVLINKGSASASEILSGALRDHKRAKLVGEVSFGKGTIQEAEDLGNGAGIHITIAKWLTPNETWVHEIGLTPDIEVKADPKDPNHDTTLERAVEELTK